MTIGIIALQGDYDTHAQALEEVGVKPRLVRKPEHAGFRLAAEGGERLVERDGEILDGLVLPGGESSTMDLLGRRYGLDLLLQAYDARKKTIFGTCAGAIWLGKGTHHKVTPLGLADVRVQRNAYGRQVDSHISPVRVRGLDEPFEAVFIRAPVFTDVGRDVEVLATHRGDPVLVRQGHIWLASFHPERTDDRRLHRLVFGG
jgi:5'-phosphate synthase pdxT subunit